MLLRISLVLGTVLALYQVNACQPELVEDAESMVTVGYDRQRKTALYVDALSVDMKNKKKFSTLLTSSCNSRRDASVKIEMRKLQSSAEWQEMGTARITAKHYDQIKNLDPCSIYEVRVSIVPKKKRDGESRSLPIFTVGPYHELDPEDIAIAKFKKEGEHYFTENFKPEYTKVTDNSFTVKWDPICAQGINVWVKDEDQDWEDGKEKKILNDIKSPTTEVTFDVQHCTNFEVLFEFFLDSNFVEDQKGYDVELELLTTDPNKNELKTNFMEHSYDNTSKILNWDYADMIDQFDCLESFSYKLVKDENGDTEELKKGSHEDTGKGEFKVGSLRSDCNFAIRTEIEYETVLNHIDSIDGFEIHIQKKDQKDNIISVNETDISFEVNPCVADRSSEIVIGLTEIGREGKELHGRMLESRLTGKVPVDQSMSDIKRSNFDEMNLKSCVAYKIMLLRRSNQDFKELETASFDNPKWSTWKNPTLLGIDISVTSITMEITDTETDGECAVRYYNINCTDVGGDDTTRKVFQSNEELKLDGLSPETEYNCTGRIVHTIPGSEDLETPWSEFVVIKTEAPVPETTTPPPTPEPKPDPDPDTVTHEQDVVPHKGEKSGVPKTGVHLSCVFFLCLLLF